MRFTIFILLLFASLKGFCQEATKEFTLDTSSHSFRYLDSAVIWTCGNPVIVPARKLWFNDTVRQLSVDTIVVFRLEEEKIQKDVALVKLINKIITEQLPLDTFDTLVRQIAPDFVSYKWRTPQMNYTAKTMSIAGNYLNIELKAIVLDNNKRFTMAQLRTLYYVKCRDNWHWGFLEIDPTFFKRYVMPQITTNYQVNDAVLIGDFEAVFHYAHGL